MRDRALALARIRERKRLAETAYEAAIERLNELPEYAENSAELNRTRFELARRRVYGLPLGDLPDKEAELEKNLRNTRERNGVSEGPSYSCPICGDAGTRGGILCSCAERERIKINLENNPDLTAVPENFSSIDMSFYKDFAPRYKKYAEYLGKERAKGEKRTILLSGKPGTGKSYFAYVFANEAVRGGKSVLTINSVKLNRLFLEYHCSPLEKKDSIRRDCDFPDLLVIDDLGAEALTKNVTVQYLYAVIAGRTSGLTLITSNLDLKGIEERYGQRILSRLCDRRTGAVLLFDGKDFRL